MSEEKPSLAKVLNNNRSIVLALLGVPVLGMLIAVAVIYFKKPDNMIVVFGVILFVGMQYILMMFFFMKRVEALAKKEEEESRDEKIDLIDREEVEPVGDQLEPEEKRVFPVEEES